MAPRKRRARTSSVSNAQGSAAGSGSNSHATSSPSSHPNSKSDNDSVERAVFHSARPPKADLAYNVRPKLRSSRETTPRERSMSAEPDDNRQVDGVGKDDPRVQKALKAFEEGQKIIAENGGRSENFTVAEVAMCLYRDMINWAVTDVAVQFKQHLYLSQEAKRCEAAFDATGAAESEKGRQNKRRAVKIVPGSYGSGLLYSDKNVTVECSHCSSNISASRYAQHVEKCLGRGGRMSSRAASARMRASAERAEREAAADMEDPPTKRRRHGSTASDRNSTDHGDNGGYGGGSTSYKRRKMSPVPSGGSTGFSQGSMQGRGLPPSGRTRASPP